MRTQVGIVGAGPAGLLLSHLLALGGVESVVVENRSREHVEGRIRAGLLEQGTVDLLVASGLGDRLRREGLQHRGIYLQWPGERHHLDFLDLTGRTVWVYGQTEVVKDLVAARLAAGQRIEFDAGDTSVHGVADGEPSLRFRTADGVEEVVECEIVAGCDGFHGISRETVPAPLRRDWQRSYPYAWLGILADVAPSTDELIYAWHPNGFALHSMRSPSISRLYLQVDPDARLADWPDDRVWSELAERLAAGGWSLRSGPVLDKSITAMRSFVGTPMRHGRLLLAGDAAHIVPPTGAKGLNLAVADVKLLAEALLGWFERRDDGLLDRYETTALRRVWRATHFSWWMTSMLHTSGDDFDAELQLSQLRRVCSSEAAARELAENYAGLPL